MKKEIRVIGIDDGPFSFHQSRVTIIGAIVRGNSYLEGILKTEIDVDGTDATKRISTSIKKSRYRSQIKAIFLDGAALGGFNIVDIDALHTATKTPVITLTRKRPNLQKMKQALIGHFTDWEPRWNLLSKNKIYKIEEPYPLYIKYVGITFDAAKRLITHTTRQGAIPEPLRIAHIIATGVTQGESSGRA